MKNEFDILFEQYITKRIYHPRSVSLSSEFKTFFASQYLKQRVEHNVKPESFLKAVMFLINDLEKDIKNSKYLKGKTNEK